MTKIKAPNFLENFDLSEPKTQLTCGAVFLFVVVGLFLAVLQIFSPSLAMLGLFLSVVLVLVSYLAIRPEMGFYILAVVSIFNGWEINFSQYEWARNLPILLKINAPIGDFFAVILFVSVVFSLFFGWLLFGHKIQYKLLPPGSAWYGIFLFVGLVMSYFAYDHQSITSFYFWLRNLLFAYLVFFLLPYYIINKKEILIKLFKVWFWLGIVIAVYGFSSLFVNASSSWLRVSPYVINGMAPLGINHNLLAEPLIMIIPGAIFLYFYFKQRDSKLAQWYFWGTLFILSIALLTLSRAAWLSLLAGIVVMFYFYRVAVFEYLKQKRFNYNWLWSLLFMPIVFYMFNFLANAPIVGGSTSSRWEATQVTWFYFAQQPIFGYGPGMYLEIFNDTQVLLWDYGDPLESHGFLQKIVLEQGIVGLSLFLGFIVWLIYTLYKNLTKARGDDVLLYQLILAMAVMAVVFQLFNTSYFRSVMWLPLALTAVSIKLLNSEELEKYGK
ncbi:MAG TPA: hypothetical protein DEB09_05400 [Candidatus Magasanikbacteria bacterium]|nr:hypothetical protein [Candidatus Magasanikbacteria bacterium]